MARKSTKKVAEELKEQETATAEEAAKVAADAQQETVETKEEKTVEEKTKEPAKAKKTTKKAATTKAAATKKTTAKKTTKTTTAKKTADAKKEQAAKDAKEIVMDAEKVKEVLSSEDVKVEIITEPELSAEEQARRMAEEMIREYGPRRSVAFIGSECYPFVKTGGLGDVMYALPKVLAKLNCDVKVIIPRYKCIPQKYQEKMVYKGDFQMNLCADGTSYYVGIMEYVEDGVVYDFIDNEFFFTCGNPYMNLVDDIPKYCYFGKAALAALNFLNWSPNLIHCHDWQAALVPIYLHEMFGGTAVGGAKTLFTIHNLRFQGVYNIETIKYWSGLPDYVFNKDVLVQNYVDANMLKGGLTYCNMITTVSNTYAGEIQTHEYGEGLDAHLRYHSNKIRGIVNGIDCDIWNPETDARIQYKYSIKTALMTKKKNKEALQKALGLEVDENKYVIGLISRLTNQKGLDLVNAIMNQIMDEHTQVVVLGTGDGQYENSFRYYEDTYKGRVCAYIAYDEDLAHQIYAGADALLVPSQFEPCGLTQLIAMRYGTVPIVRETGGLKDTVEPYNQYINAGNGFTFDRYEVYLLYDAINRSKTLYFTERDRWDEMVIRNMEKDVSWEKSARQYKSLYLELTGGY